MKQPIVLKNAKCSVMSIDSESDPELNMQRVTFTIYGTHAQKGNGRRIVTNRASMKPMLIKSKQAIAWWHSATLQLRELGILGGKAWFTGHVAMTVHAYYADDKPDLDISVLKDVLQTRWNGKGKARTKALQGLYENDNQVREEHNFYHVGSSRPRMEVTVETLGASAAWGMGSLQTPEYLAEQERLNAKMAENVGQWPVNPNKLGAFAVNVVTGEMRTATPEEIAKYEAERRRGKVFVPYPAGGPGAYRMRGQTVGFYAADGTLMEAPGRRSIFDDVDR